MTDQKKYNVYDFPLHEVTTESIRMSEDERKKYNQNLEKVLESIINQMKTDETFKCLYRTKGYAGSSYENLKINKPNEFDINLNFVWPVNACQIIYDSKQPGYVKLKVNLENSILKKMRDETPTFEKQLKKWIDTDGFFMRMKFKSWMQGRVVKAIEAISVDGTEIKQSASGPAITLKVQQNSEKLNYSVDLVPAFLFTEKEWPKKLHPLPSSVKCKEWSVVPKDPPSEDKPVYWRMTFYTQEKELMNDRHSLKHVIKLIKLLRDKENWNNDLYSYAIKTIFLWECEKLDTNFWKHGVGFLFVYMLQKLSDYLAKGIIPYYWDEKLNLIEKTQKPTRENMKDRICAILKVFNLNIENPYSIKKYFGCVPEKVQQSSSENNFNPSLIELDVPDDHVLPILSARSPPQNLLESEIKPEIEKVNVDQHCAFEYNQMCGSDSTVDSDSASAMELLRTILQEQQEMKKCLQSLLLQFSELSKEVRILRQENSHLKEQFQGSTTKSISTSPSTETIENLLSLEDLSISHSAVNQKCCSGRSPMAIQQNSIAVSNEVFSPVQNFKRDKDHFSNLLPDNFGKN